MADAEISDGGSDSPEPSSRPPLPEMLAQLADDGKAWVRAEAAVYQAVARRRLIGAAIVAGLFALAAVLSFAALSAALFGVILALAPSLGTGAATLIVTLGTLMVAALLALVGRWRLSLVLKSGVPE